MEENRLTVSDLRFVLSRCPRDILKLLKENAGTLFLAGGFIRSTVAGEKVSDIDLFGITQEDLLRIAKDLTLARKGRFFTTNNAITVLSPPRFPVQFITRWLYAEASELVKSFDFTVCQAVIWAEHLNKGEVAEEGKEVKKKYRFHSVCSDMFYSDLAAKRLVYTFPQRNEDVGGSLLRAIRFVKKGYNIQAPSLAGVVSRLMGSVRFSAIDNTSTPDNIERWRAQVITGLLREVDPLTVIDGVDFVDEHEVVSEEDV
jgi:hypothetical protein